MKNFMISCILFLTTIITVNASICDSVGTTVRNGKKYIVHELEAGETLYALHRKYSVSVEEIKNANSGLNMNEMAIGQKLYIPLKGGSARQTNSTPASVKNYHTVQAGETLYAISRKYGVTVEQIKKWNNFSSNSLDVGQKIKVSDKTTSGEAPAIQTEKKNDKVSSEGKLVTVGENKLLNQVHEEGTATMTNNPQYQSEYAFCLHKTAPVGTIVKITNKKTNKSAYARVRGILGSDESSVIKINKTVKEYLEADEDTFEVKVYYIL